MPGWEYRDQTAPYDKLWVTNFETCSFCFREEKREWALLHEIADRFRMGHCSSGTASFHLLKARIEEAPRVLRAEVAMRHRLDQADCF